MIPIFISDAEFAARAKARAAGKLDEWKPKETITQPPKAFFDWVENNRERAKGWGNMPHFIRDNYKYGDIKNGLKASVDIIENEVRKTQAQPVEPEPKPQPKPHPKSQESVPELLKRGSSYFGGKVLELDNAFFELLDKTKPVVLKITAKGGSYYSHGNSTVVIENAERAARSD
jgi:hypothetical protein